MTGISALRNDASTGRPGGVVDVTPDEVAEHLGTDTSAGLAPAEAVERLAEYGPNRLATPPVDARVAPFRRPVPLGAGGAAGVGRVAAAATLVATEGRHRHRLGAGDQRRAGGGAGARGPTFARRAPCDARATARVRRGGQTVEVDAADLVPGDIVLLEAGHCVPADARIAVCVDGEADESSLTGESLAVDKTDAAVDVPTPRSATARAWSG